MKPVVFFDLDGTLTDPRPGIVGSIQHALRELDRPVPEERELLWCIGPPLRNSFTELLGAPHEVDRAVTLYRERFGSIGLYENRVYPGVPALLQRLGELGVECTWPPASPTYTRSGSSTTSVSGR